MVYRKGSPLNGSPCFSSKSSISRFISSRSSSVNITGSNSCQCGRGSAVLLYHLKGLGNILDRRALGRMDESPDRREGAVVRLDNDRSQRHDAKNTQRRKQSLSDAEILTSEQERLWLDPAIVLKEAATDLLTVYPEEEMTAWAVRQKFNYGNPFNEGIIEPVAEQQNLGL